MTSPTPSLGAPRADSAVGVAFVALMISGLAAIAAVVSFGFSVRDRGSSNARVDSAAAAPAVTQARVRLTDFKIQPDRDSFPAGPIKLRVANNGSVKHSLVIDGVAKTPDINPGSSASLDLGSLEPGTYKWYCSVAGHVEVGMTGTFTVVARPDGISGSADSPASEPVSTDAPKTDIDGAHAAVVKAFLAGPPAKTEGLGGLPLQPTTEAGIRTFDLTAKVVQWEVSPGRRMEAWGYNGVVPGPQIRVKQGETVKVRLKNELPESTSIHTIFAAPVAKGAGTATLYRRAHGRERHARPRTGHATLRQPHG